MATSQIENISQRDFNSIYNKRKSMQDLNSAYSESVIQEGSNRSITSAQQGLRKESMRQEYNKIQETTSQEKFNNLVTSESSNKIQYEEKYLSSKNLRFNKF